MKIQKRLRACSPTAPQEAEAASSHATVVAPGIFSTVTPCVWKCVSVSATGNNHAADVAEFESKRRLSKDTSTKPILGTWQLNETEPLISTPVPQISPSPWPACMSPRLKSAPLLIYGQIHCAPYAIHAIVQISPVPTPAGMVAVLTHPRRPRERLRLRQALEMTGNDVGAWPLDRAGVALSHRYHFWGRRPNQKISCCCMELDPARVAPACPLVSKRDTPTPSGTTSCIVTASTFANVRTPSTYIGPVTGLSASRGALAEGILWRHPRPPKAIRRPRDEEVSSGWTHTQNPIYEPGRKCSAGARGLGAWASWCCWIMREVHAARTGASWKARKHVFLPAER